MRRSRSADTHSVVRANVHSAGDAGGFAQDSEKRRAVFRIVAKPLVDRGAWIAVARSLVDDWTVHPSCSGVACGLLYLAQEMPEDDVARIVGKRVSDTSEPEQGAAFLAGFLEVNALVLVKSKPVVAALDAFLVGIERDRVEADALRADGRERRTRIHADAAGVRLNLCTRRAGRQLHLEQRRRLAFPHRSHFAGGAEHPGSVVIEMWLEQPTRLQPRDCLQRGWRQRAIKSAHLVRTAFKWRSFTWP